MIYDDNEESPFMLKRRLLSIVGNVIQEGKQIRKEIFMSRVVICLIFIGIIFTIFVNTNEFSSIQPYLNDTKSRDNVFKKVKYGDLAVFSIFINETIFIDGTKEQILFVPSRKNTIPRVFFRFRVDFPYYYIWPSKVVIDNNYNYKLSKEEFEKIRKEELLMKKYNDFLDSKFYVYRQDKNINYSQWALYSFTQKDQINIFVAPFPLSQKIRVK
jgi:hypothetical protein